MTQQRDDWIGLRVAAYRVAAGLTQQQLADRVRIGPNGEGCSANYIYLLESGRKPVGTRRLLLALAEGLGVSPTDLTPRPLPRQAADGSYAIDRAVPRIRAALDSALEVPGHAINFAALSPMVSSLMAARMACDYERLGEHLPSTIAQALWLVKKRADPAAIDLMTRVMVCASLAIRPLGYVDLAVRLAARARAFAYGVGLEAGVAACDYALAQCHLASGVHGLRRRSLEVADRAANHLDGLTGITDEIRGWQVMLNLQTGLAAASLGDDDTADTYAEAATALVRHVQHDPWSMEVTPANVAVWRVAIAAEGESPERAVVLSRQVATRDLRTKQRQAHLMIHQGHALHLAEDTSAAIAAFYLADRIAPDELRHRTRVREAVGEILRTARREAGSDELKSLAVNLGIDPLSQ
jgi:transcriptional regulator with XRE-family HTH domain